MSGRFHDDSVRLRHRGGICGAQIPAGIFFFQGKHLRSLPGRDLQARRPAACLARRIPPPKWPAPLSSRNAPILAVPSAITSTNFAYIVSGSAGEFLSFFKCSLKKYLFPKVSWYFLFSSFCSSGRSAPGRRVVVKPKRQPTPLWWPAIHLEVKPISITDRTLLTPSRLLRLTIRLMGNCALLRPRGGRLGDAQFLQRNLHER